MLKTLTRKLRRHSLNDIHSFQLKCLVFWLSERLKRSGCVCVCTLEQMAAGYPGLDMISYHDIEEGGESDDSEGENQELAQIDRERRRNCILTPLATSQQHNQGVLSPAHLRHLRFLLDPTLDHHSSEEELERIAGATGAEGGRKWQRHGDISSASSDEEVKDLCGQNELPVGVRLIATSPRPVLFRSSPPRALKLSHTPTCHPVRPIIRSYFEQPSMPYWRNRPAYTGEPGRPSLDLEKMRQKMLLKKNCGGKTRTIKIRKRNLRKHNFYFSFNL
ncbi:hypothetical protein E1301_Tti006338 [Triplophysa tibetana]|uniref:Uncharacterized protein n=1 Tax=Triplophysa tibetana TaxID=1572043 RepID=A0A5A9NQW4_9TELE|nr:hypothetical protein E1301_Tti006338 [Triplophysa tibetana]